MLEQEKKGTVRRLGVLDGLRGFAIILVFLNHIDSSFIAQAVPSFFKPIVQFLFTSGNLGVTFFFILSGFLMGYLYARPSPRTFIERRYARIFPPFFVMVTCMWILHLYPRTPLIGVIALMLGIAYMCRLVWVHIVEKFHLGRGLITLFLLFQLLVAVWYGFFIMRRPPIWFDSLPFFIREGTIYLSNLTLTLSLGNYIPLLDGVYWSLAPEMIFYLLYPLLFAPTVDKLKKRGVLFVILFCIFLFPFFFGLSQLFRHSQGLAMLFVEYFIYFCGGIGIASLLRAQSTKKKVHFSKNIMNPLSFFLILFFAYFALGKSYGIYTILVRLFLVFPFGYIVYSLIEDETPLSRLFQKKLFLYLGAISYSMYIGHTAVVNGMHLIFSPSSILTNVLFLIATSFIFLLTSSALHYIIETPYFQFKPVKTNVNVSQYRSKTPIYIFFIFILYLFFTFYTSQFNFFSLQKKYSIQKPSSIEIGQHPYTFTFTSQEDNMGVILLHLTNTISEVPLKMDKRNYNKQQRFQIRMKERGASNWHATQDSSPGEIGESKTYPFGFPLIPNSKNKTYIVEMSIKDFDGTSVVKYSRNEYSLLSVHQVPRQTLLKNPPRLLAHIGEKLQVAFANPEAQLTATCIIPFFILLFVL